jgi:hypothetical protein
MKAMMLVDLVTVALLVATKETTLVTEGNTELKTKQINFRQQKTSCA